MATPQPFSGLDATAARPPFWRYLAGAAPLILFLIAAGYGVMERHNSNDTFTALSTGRYIMETGRVPTTDPFSYTFAGKPWFNQNWFSHLILWWAYDWFGPNAVILVTWLMGWAMFALGAVAIRSRSGSWTVGWLGGAFVAVASYGYLSARPATFGYFCLSAFCALLALLMAPGPRRIWPAVLMLPLFLMWANGHGSFIFGYAMLGFLGALWAGGRIGAFKRKPVGRVDWQLGPIVILLVVGGLIAIVGLVRARNSLPPFPLDTKHGGLLGLAGFAWLLVWLGAIRPVSDVLNSRQIVVLGGATVLSVVLTILFGPYGLQNFTHPFVITESAIFRTVNEWVPPYKPASYPPVWGFWVAVAVTAAALALSSLLRLTGTAENKAPREGAKADGPALNMYDVLAVAIGIAMALFARRFAPLFYLLAAPPLVTLIVLQLRGADSAVRERWSLGVQGATWAAAGLLAVFAGATVYGDYIAPYRDRPDFNLMERAVQFEGVPETEIQFLDRNGLKANVFTQWILASMVTFYAPQTKVYIDGRAQQLYDEEIYATYQLLTANDKRVMPRFVEILASSQTDVVLFRLEPRVTPLVKMLGDTQRWQVVLGSPLTLVMMLRGSAPLEQFWQSEREGKAWWPDTPFAAASRGNLWNDMQPRDPQKALGYLLDALRADVMSIPTALEAATRLYVELGKPAEAMRLMQELAQRLNDPKLPQNPETRRRLLAEVGRIRQSLARGQAGG